MFRLQRNVPEIYVDKSRDFQLFCRLYDSVFGGVKYSIDSLALASVTKECDAALLELLKTKLGMFTVTKFDDYELRCILQSFPTIMRYKGSRKAIDYVLTLYSRITHSETNFATYDVEALKDCKLILTFAGKLTSDTLLRELIKYVIPTGYQIEYNFVDSTNSKTEMYVHNKLSVETNDPEMYSTIKHPNNDSELASTTGVTFISSIVDSVEDSTDE